MSLVACPFCRELFTPSEHAQCPECGLSLTRLDKLPPSYDAVLEDPSLMTPPEMERRRWNDWSRGRGMLLLGSALGLLLFALAPWVHEYAPDVRILTGLTLAQKLGWYWAPGVAYFVMFPLVASRRTIVQMRGARVAVMFLLAIVLTVVTMRIVSRPVSTVLRPVRFEWGWGLYASGILAFVLFVFASRFGGSIQDLPSKEKRTGSETLH